MTDSHNTDEFSERLTDHLRDEAELIPHLPTGGDATDRIERRAVRAQRRRTAAVGTAMALAVAGVGAGAMLASAPTNELISADQVSLTADDALTEELDEATAATTNESADAADGSSSDSLEPPALVSDGPAMSWTEVAAPTAEFVDVFVHEGQFMAVGNSSDGTSSLWSSADGTDWAQRPVPVTAENWSAVSSGDAIVITGFPPSDDVEDPSFGQTWFSIDLGDNWRLLDLPGINTPTGFDGFSTVAALGDVVVASVTIDDPASAPNGPLVTLFRSVADGPFEPVDLGQLELGDFVEVRVNAGAFELTVYDNFERRFTSSDGETWTGASTSSTFRQVVQGGAQDQLALSYSGEFPSLQRSSDGGATWQEPFEIDDLLVVGAAFNADGYVLNVQAGGFEEFEEPLVSTMRPSLTKGGFEISIDVEFEEITVIDLESGEEVFRTELDENGEGDGLTYDEGDDVVTITDQETGEIILSFSGEEFAAANEAMFNGIDGLSSNMQIGFTADGETYGWQTAAEAFGVDGGWIDLDSNGDVILATVFTSEGPAVFAATGPTG